jgi:hypothetical protein
MSDDRTREQKINDYIAQKQREGSKGVVVMGNLPKSAGDPKQLAASLAAMDAGVAVDARTLPSDDEFRVHAEAQVKYWTQTVGFLKTPQLHPHPQLNSLMQDAWNICNNQIVRCSILPQNPVPSLSFTFFGNATKSTGQGLILFPNDYEQQFRKDAIYCMGGVVFVASQVVDYYNQKFTPDEVQKVPERAKMWEAEFLLTIKRALADEKAVGFPKAERNYQFNEYQIDVLNRFPQGIKSVPELLYEREQTPQPSDAPPPVQ